MRLRRTGGFTLLEIIIAMGVLAVGATAAFAVLVAAAAAGRRAEHQVNAALIAETTLNDMNGFLVGDVDLDQFKKADADPDANVGGDPRPPANPNTRYILQNETWEIYPGYKYDVAITPLEGSNPNETWHYLIEVEVRWAEKGRRRSEVFSTVMLKNISHLDNPIPPKRR